MITSLRQHWKIYAIEGLSLGIFMVSASFFGTMLEYPRSVVHLALPNEFLRRCLMGFAMGTTATFIIYSPMGKLSGAHMNPALTLTFLMLGKIKRNDAIFYAIFQCMGGILAIALMTILLGDAFKDEPVNYVITAPGKSGAVIAFGVEVIIALCMMTMVLTTSNHPKFSGYTGFIAGFFVMSYVVLSGPISGFSMNPARTLASAVPSGMYPFFWIYMTAPFLGMFSSAALYKALNGKTICAKMHHSDHLTCIFNCGYCKHYSTIDESNTKDHRPSTMDFKTNNYGK